MSPQLTVQTPLQLPPAEIPSYLDQFWSHNQSGNKGANTFCLIVWQPAWMEQTLIKNGKLKGPIIGNQRLEIIEAARKQAEGEIAVHKANILVYQTMPAGIGEHSDVTEAVIAELDKLAAADDRLEMIDKYFSNFKE